MQTFVPLETFEESVASLDYRRKGKQRVETMQIMKALAGLGGWQRHPATLMWEGYEPALMEYQRATCNDWVERHGFKDTCLEKTQDIYDKHFAPFRDGVVMPDWWGGIIHETHRSNLVRKNTEFYRPLFPNVRDDLEYYWPTKETA